MRITIAAITGGIILFIWSAVAHMATPLGRAGLSTLPNEEAVRESLRANVPRPGLYLFPATSERLTSEEQKVLKEKVRSGPSGLLAYKPAGGEFFAPRQFISELVTNILAAAVAAILLSFMAAPYITKAVLTAMLAVFAFLSITASRWIWDAFPTAFVAAELTMEFIGWLLAGLAMAKIVTSRIVVPVAARE